VFEYLYKKVSSGAEARRVIEANSRPDYRHTLDKELHAIAESELGEAGAVVRENRSSEHAVTSIENPYDAVMAGSFLGLFHSQYELLRRKVHYPSEAFNETSEEATQSLYPLIDEHGIPWMYRKCSTTAQRGALDWNPVFKTAIQPKIDRLYKNQLTTADEVIEEILNSEMWGAGRTVRSLRPERQKIA